MNRTVSFLFKSTQSLLEYSCTITVNWWQFYTLDNLRITVLIPLEDHNRFDGGVISKDESFQSLILL